MSVKKHLESIRKLKRKQYHPIIHEVHKKHRISKKTLFYVKEYGPHSNIPKVIIRESLRILVLASIVSSLGGLAMENMKSIFAMALPLVILLPAMNNMIGNYGTILSSRFSTMLHEGQVRGSWKRDRHLRRLFFQMTILSVITSVAVSLAAVLMAWVLGFSLQTGLLAKVLAITVLDVIILVIILFAVAVASGIHFYKNHEDPNNFLIPITTSLADFANMAILAGLVTILF